jgi:hypothetical protein
LSTLLESLARYEEWQAQSESKHRVTVTTATTDTNTNTDAILRAATDALAASADVVVDGDSGAAAAELPRDAAAITPPRRVLYSGSCFCGEVTVRCFEKPRTVSYCHCSICRKLTGAPFSCQVSIARCSSHFRQPSRSQPSTHRHHHSARHFIFACSAVHSHPPTPLPSNMPLSVSLISTPTPLCVKAVFQSTDVSIELEPGGKLHSFNTSRSVARHRCVTCMSPVKATLFNGKLTAVPLGLISSWRGTGGASSSSAPGAARPANSDEETPPDREESAAGSLAAHAATRESAGTGASAGAARASNAETEADGEPEPLRPLHHIHYSSRVVDVVDGLPKYASTVREVTKGKGGHGGLSGASYDRKGKGAGDTKARGGRGNAQRSESQSAHQTEGVEVNTNTEGEPALELVGKMVPETD